MRLHAPFRERESFFHGGIMLFKQGSKFRQYIVAMYIYDILSM